MLILRDDQVIETFTSPGLPPTWIETIDVENEEYEFCDTDGQRFIGKITKGKNFYSLDTFELVPDGAPNIDNLTSILDRALFVERNKQVIKIHDFRASELGL